MEEVNTLEIDGKEYILLDTITNNNNTYHYFSNESDVNDIEILKDSQDDFVSIDTESEWNEALTLFLNKHKDDIEKTAA